MTPKEPVYQVLQPESLRTLQRLYAASPFAAEMAVRDGQREAARPKFTEAIEAFRAGQIGVAEFRTRLDSLNKSAETDHFGAGGIGFQMFFNLLVRYVPQGELEQSLRTVIEAPDLTEAVERFNAFADDVSAWRDRLKAQIVLPYRSVHFFLSFLWHLQAPALYPVSYPAVRDAVDMLVKEQVLAMTHSPTTDGDGYMGFRQLHLDLAALLGHGTGTVHTFEAVEHLLFLMGRQRYLVHVAEPAVWRWSEEKNVLAFHGIEGETAGAKQLLGALSKLQWGDLVAITTGSDQLVAIGHITHGLQEDHSVTNGLRGWFGQRLNIQWILTARGKGVPLSAIGGLTNVTFKEDDLPVRPIGLDKFRRLGAGLLEIPPQPLPDATPLLTRINELEQTDHAITVSNEGSLQSPAGWSSPDGTASAVVRPIVKGIVKAGEAHVLSATGLPVDELPDSLRPAGTDSYRLVLVADQQTEETPPAPEPTVEPRPTAPRLLHLSPADLTLGALEFPPRVVERACAALNAGKHLMLSGPPGTGKTSIAGVLAARAVTDGICQLPLVVTATANWSTFDTLGGYVPDGHGSLAFRPGLFLQALRENRWLVIDEINRADIDKSFGEFFSLLTGQTVTLPFRVGEKPVVVVPEGARAPEGAEVFRMPPNWRLIGTMNVYDKSSLFQLSYAFMRRFAFVDVGIPSDEQFAKLVDQFFRTAGGAADEQVTEVLTRLFSHSEDGLLHLRELGPAILKDVVEFYVALADVSASGALVNLAEAVNAYVLPQLEGLESRQVEAAGKALSKQFKESSAREVIEHRLREMFPYVKLA